MLLARLRRGRDPRGKLLCRPPFERIAELADARRSDTLLNAPGDDTERFSGVRDREEKGRSLAGDGLHPDIALVLLDDHFANRKANPRFPGNGHGYEDG